MDLTTGVAEEIPRGNLRVSRDAFVALWRLAEHVGAYLDRFGSPPPERGPDNPTADR